MAGYRIVETLDVFVARSGARDLALRLGFDRIAAQEICIVVSELATNILKYGVRGEIVLEADGDPVHGLRVVARDRGPPFADLAAALRDGYDDRGPLDPASMARRHGIGGGLGAVVRLTDSFACEPELVGKRIVVTRALVRPRFPRSP